MILTQNEIIEKLRTANELLADALIGIKKENQNGQFDYCTSSALSDLCSAIEVKSNAINKIVYQQ